MDIRERKNPEMNDLQEEDLSDSIIYNLTKKKIIRNELEKEYFKQYYSQPTLPYLPVNLYSNYPIFYLLGATIFHTVTFKHRRISFLDMSLHAAIIISLN